MDINELRELLENRSSGRQLTRLYTRRVDSYLRDVFASVAPATGLCLMAVGGYGRGELAPFSDIDIMLFARDRSPSEQASAFLYKLWDAGFTVGHSFRTPADCIRESGKDIRTRTSLLEHRFLVGDEDLHRSFLNSVYPEIAYREPKRFVGEKLREMEARHRKTGNSVFLLEPQIKEGKGSLRDIHTILWLASVRQRIRDFDGLSRIFSPVDFRRLERSYDFLLKVRFCLHLLSGRRNDVLSFDYHDRIAQMLGFKPSPRFLSSERFMRFVYLKSSVVCELAYQAFELFTAPARGTDDHEGPRIFSLFSGRKRISEDFSLSQNVIVAREDIFRNEPEKIIDAFSVMARTGKRFSPALRRSLKRHLLRIGKRTRRSPRAVDAFLRIVTSGRAYETLRSMHASGVLGRFIPEFGALTSLVVYEPYHRYTVDEHSLYAVKKIDELRNTKYKHLEHLAQVFAGLRHQEALVFSLLFHDIGKAGIVRTYRYGSGGGHHEDVGYRLLKGIMERFTLPLETRGMVEFLVKNHLLMSSLAFKREIEDPEIVAQFADEVADRENLDALYLLTYADMAAVSDDFLTEWKAYLLRDLYETAVRYLEGAGGGLEERIERVSAISGLRREERDEAKRFLASMPKRYVTSTTADRVFEDCKLAGEVRAGGFGVRVREDAVGTAEITVGAWDSPGLFSRIVGVLSSMEMNIYRARIYTSQDGLAIDKIQVSNWNDLAWEGMASVMAGRLHQAVSAPGGEEPDRRCEGELRELSAHAAGGAERLGRFGPFIEIDNETLSDNSLVELFASDRLGLLFDITRLIHEKDIDIISARINTEKGIAHDIFTVRHSGGKLAGMAVQDLLVSLWERLD